jgi:murein endopeptidase
MYQDVILSGQDDKDWLKAYDRVLEGQADADVTLEDEVLWYKGRLWVPDSVDLRKMILQEEHVQKWLITSARKRRLNFCEETSFGLRWINGLKIMFGHDPIVKRTR